jgi:hypothetical protein
MRTRALLDSGYFGVPESQRWSRTSPQHIDAQSLARLFPTGFFEHMFTLVRHPAERLRSAYLHQRDIEERVDPDEGFSAWLRALPERRANDPWYLDNHSRPMGDLVPESCVVFRLEEGANRIVNWIDELMGNQNGPRAIAMAHRYEDRLAQSGKRPRGDDVEITAEDAAFIYQTDRADFERFGYHMVPQQKAPVV